MSLEFRASVYERGFDLGFEVGAGEVVALMGPNGSGKSTTLSAIAGLLHPDAGRVVVNDRVLFDSISRVRLAPHDRSVALLAQEALLFPHLSALDNVAFGPRSGGASRRESRAAGRSWLDAVEATSYADRLPRQLSGGQAQRVALARALAADPQLLLLDEPLAALDVPVAASMRQLLRRVLRDRKRPAVIITHDVLDALLLADRVLVLEGGHLVEQGPTAELLARPHSAFAARIAGLNMVRGTWDGRSVQGADALAIEGLAEQPISRGNTAVAVFRPSAVSVFRDAPGGSPRNAVEVVITELEPLGEQVRVRSAQFSADVTVAAVADLDLAPGVRVVLSVKASEVAIYRA